MIVHILASIISDDKPGIVEAIAETISKQGGSWLQSRLTQLSGKFAGVVHISIDQTQQASLEQALSALEHQGIWIKYEQQETNKEASHPLSAAYIHVLGPDRTGIVHELSCALANQQINVANLETYISSMPYSGDPLFEAIGALEIPNNANMHTLQESLDKIADALALDIALSEQPPERN